MKMKALAEWKKASEEFGTLRELIEDVLSGSYKWNSDEHVVVDASEIGGGTWDLVSTPRVLDGKAEGYFTFRPQDWPEGGGVGYNSVSYGVRSLNVDSAVRGLSKSFDKNGKGLSFQTPFDGNVVPLTSLSPGAQFVYAKSAYGRGVITVAELIEISDDVHPPMAKIMTNSGETRINADYDVYVLS